jgi:hypothetical protein
MTMIPAHHRTVATAALGAVASVLLAGCSSSAPAVSANAAGNSSTPAVNAVPSSSVVAAPTSGPAQTPVAASTPAHATTSGGGHACSLVTEQEASAALGADPGPGQSDTSGPASSCMYGSSPSIVTVNLVPVGGKQYFDHARQVTGSAGHEVTVSGIGDEAFSVASGPAASVEFVKGDALVAIVILRGMTGSPAIAQATVLAKLAASRI